MSMRAQLPSANFSGNPTAGCSPLVVNFTDQSTGNPTSWSWDFGNGNTSTLQNPSALYFSPGSYTVKLTVTNATGSNTLTRQQYITVYETPTVNFSGLPTNGCFPLRVQFTDLSTPGSGNTNTAWLWDFGNGNTSSLQNPLITYSTAGTFSVTLKVTNDKGCSRVLSKPNYISVTPGVQAGFTNTQPTVCHPPTNISFTNTSVGPGLLSYSWNFGDAGTSALQNPTHTFLSPGTFTVTLITSSSSGCVDTIRNNVTITNNTTAFNAPDSVCVNTPVNFQNVSVPSPASSFWDFGDASTSTAINPVKTYVTPGLYDIKLINTYANCQDSAFKTIRILARPVADFTAPATARCEPPFTVNFQDLSTGPVGWQWNFGDGGTSTQQNPSHTYSSYGNFNVTLIVTNASGCTDTILKPQFVKIARAQISIPALPARGCIPYTLNPVANITALDAVTSYFWDFGDGGTSNSATPSHTYIAQGTYTVKLFITTSTGCTDSLVVPAGVRVGTHPTANFTASPIPQCAYQPVQFTDLSAPFVDEWLWDFGDGITSSFQNPLHAYDTVGNFTVTLTATNNGCPDVLSKPNYIVSLPPIARFSATTNCSNRLQFNFTDQSIGPVTWAWDFGDGGTSTSQNPVHIFPTLGNYTVKLTVTNGSCSHSITHQIKTIDAAPDFVVSSQSGCKILYVATGAQNLNPADITNYAWSFDGITYSNTTAPNAWNYYYSSGSYTVGLITTDINGCMDTIIKPNYVRVNGPVANFTATNTSGCKGLTTTFNDLSTTDGVNTIVNWRWDFGDGTIQNFSAPPFQHAYNTAGTYSVKLIVRDSYGCMDSLISSNLIVATDPHALFASPDTLTCPSAVVNFFNQSNAINYSSAWNFGDGSTSTNNSPVHSYAATGLYTVKLKVVDQYSCPDSLIKNFYIRVDKPVAGFGVNDSVSSCIPFEVNFTNTSHYFNSLLWDFGSGSTSTMTNPTYYYSSPGTYVTKLIITSPGGCKDSITKTITVYDTVGSRIDYLPFNGCKPLTVNLTAFTPGPVTYLWDFGDGNTQSTTTPNVMHVYNGLGNFIPKVILKSNAVCLIPVTGIDTIRIVGATAKFGIDKSFFCDSGLVRFSDSTTFNDPVTVYNWNFGDGGTSVLQNPSHQYTAQGLYTVSLAVQTQAGCRDTLRQNNLIKLVQSPLVAIGGDTAVCVFSSMLHTGLFQRPDTSAVAWSWNFPNGNNAIIQNPLQQVYTTAGNFVVTTIATNSSGCKDTAVKNITIYPLPVATLPGTLTMAAGFPVTISATYSSNVASYLWSPAATLSCTNCPQPIANPKFNTTYQVLFTDSNGCRNTGEVTVIVICKNANVFMPNTFSPNGDGSNDVFYPRGQGINRAKSLRVFNRWGEIVFESKDFPINDPNYGWKGMYKNNKAQPGVYVYQVEFYCDNGDIIRFEGNVSLIL